MDPMVVTLLGLLALVLAILWIALPFAVFGIKSRLDTLIRLQRDANTEARIMQRGPAKGPRA